MPEVRAVLPVGRARCLSFSLLVMLAAPVGRAGEDVYRFELGRAEAAPGTVAAMPLRLDSTSPVEGLVAVLEWGAALAEGVGIEPGPALAGADLVVTRVEAGFMVLGAVLDDDGVGGEVISPGEDLELATIELRALVDTGLPRVAPIGFARDGFGFSATPGGPALDNRLVVAGLSVERGRGLELRPGSLEVVPPPPLAFRIASGEAAGPQDCGEVDVVLDNPEQAVEGYELSLAHPEELELTGISIQDTAADANGAEFAESEVLEAGGTLGVVLDLEPPFEGNVIPPGEGQTIARFTYCCREGAGDARATHPVSFLDGLGNPPKENTAVVGGLSVDPELEDGSFVCPGPTAEDCVNGLDDDADGLVDCDDADCEAAPSCELALQTVACGAGELAPDGLPFTAEGVAGGLAEVSFWYDSPDVPGEAILDQVQGLSIAVCYPCEIRCREGSLDVSDTIVEAVGVEFVSQQCDNDSQDGDGCEMVIGMLVDALPPFEGQTLPPTPQFLRLGTTTFEVGDGPEVCGRCFPVEFCDGVDGRGVVPVRNLVSVGNFSRPLRLVHCEVCVAGAAAFHRGDCNFTGGGASAVSVADAAAVLSFLFLEGSLHFEPPCLDACDCNDDGRVDIADSMCILDFMFRFGDFPPSPGPGFDRVTREAVPAGPDPTEDALDCAAGTACEV